MNTSQRVTRSSLATPQSKQASSTLGRPLTTSAIKSEPPSHLRNESVSVSTANTTPSMPVPRGLMSRDGTPASSMTRLHSELRINPLRISPNSTPTTHPATRIAAAAASGATTRGGAVKRQFKPKLPAVNDKKNDTNNKVTDQAVGIPEPKANHDKATKKHPIKRNGTIDARKQKQIVQLESSVFTGSAGILKPPRGSKPLLSFGQSSSVIGSKVTTPKETVIRTADKNNTSDLKDFVKDDYDSDNFVVSDDESDDDVTYGEKPKKKYSRIKPIGYESLHNRLNAGRSCKKKIKAEKDVGTEFNESFNVKPATDVFMKFLSLHKVDYEHSMFLIQVSEDLLKTELWANSGTSETSQEGSSSINSIGRLRMYQSGKVEIVKSDGSIFEITRTGNENILVPNNLPKVMFSVNGGTEQEYAMQSNAGMTSNATLECAKYHCLKMDLRHSEERDPSSSQSPNEKDCEPIDGILTEIAHLDPREDLIATPVIKDVISTEGICDEEMECDS